MNPDDLLPSFHSATAGALEAIEKSVAAAFKMTTEELHRDTRQEHIAWPRQVAAWMMRTKAKASLNRISDRFGKKDHTWALYSINKVDGLIECYPKLRAELEAIRAELERAQ